jgi:hypothetical protein
VADNFADVLMRAMNLQPPTAPGQLNMAPPPMAGITAPQGLDLNPQAPSFMQRMGRDPSLSLALMNAGISMMQPTPAGQTHLGHAAKGLGLGAATYIGDKERRADRAIKDTRTELLRKADARQERTAGMQENEFNYSVGRRPQKEKVEDLQLTNAETEVGYNQEKARLYKIFGEKEANARLAQIGASTNASNARAKAYADGTAGGAASVPGILQIVNSRAANLKQLHPEMSDQQAWDTAYGEQKGSKENILGAISQARTARASIISNTIGGKMSPAQQEEYDALGAWISELQGDRGTARGMPGASGTIDRTGAPPPPGVTGAAPTYDEVRQQIEANATLQYQQGTLKAMPDAGAIDQEAIKYLNTHYPGWAATTR